MSTIQICDVCGGRENIHKIQYPYDHRADGAGGMEIVYEVYDLCEKHELLALKKAIKYIIRKRIPAVLTEHEFNRVIINEIESLIVNNSKK